MITRHKGPDGGEYASLNVALTDAGGRSFELQDPQKPSNRGKTKACGSRGIPTVMGRLTSCR